jgi:putative nucleotidyltransferase with HDIG domain
VRLRGYLGWPLVVATGFWACATYIVLSGEERLHYYTGQRLSQPVFSRVGFALVDKNKTAEERRNAEQRVPNYFRFNQPLADKIQSEFRDLHAAVKASENLEAYQATNAQRWPLEAAAFTVLKAMTDEAGSERFKRNVDAIAERLADEEMIERADAGREPHSTASKVVLLLPDGEAKSVAKERLKYAANPDHVDRLARDLVRFVFAEELEGSLVAIVKNTIAPGEKRLQSVYEFDRAYTKEKVEEKLASLQPVMDAYTPGNALVGAGPVDAEELDLLKAEHQEYLRQRASTPALLNEWRWKRLGLLGVVAIVTIGLSIYTALCQPRVVRKSARSLALAMLFLLMLLTDRVVFVGMDASPMWSVATITMTAAVLTVAYSQIFAIGAVTGLCLLTIPTLGATYDMVLVLLSVAATTVLLLGEIRTRLKMIQIGVVGAVVAGIAAGFVSLSERQDALRDAAIAALAALAGTSLVMVLLPVIEKVFRITTSLTLLEWADTSKPLLRQLIERAPGTWQHSHLLGSMAEKAAESIGANGLLVRVGAYYHDVGKTCKPHYFVENQQAKMVSAHRGLAPTMSLLVILAHVKDGLALAKEHRLPPVLHQFITEHHGTTIVRYFHARAAQEAKANGRRDRQISESEFRYPGPKPGSRESAILMVCDSVEGAVRALQDPTPSRIESVVREIILARLMDGQFDNCEITLKQLARVEQSLVKSLCAIHHGRIAYPRGAEESSTQLRTA